LGLEVHDHPNPYPLAQVNKEEKLKIRKQHKIRFVISVDFIDEVDLDVIPLDVCGVVFGSPYMYMRDAIFMRRDNKYRLKDGKSFIINMHKDKPNVSLVSANQTNKLISYNKNFYCF